MKSFKNTAKKTSNPLRYVAAGMAVAVAGFGLASCSVEDRVSSGTKQGWLKTDRGYTWCLYNNVKAGATTDCDWSTLTETAPGSFIEMKSSK